MKTIFKSDDGKEHATEKGAQDHQELVDAFTAHKEARRTYALILAKTIKTADGEPLDLRSYFTKYWWIPEIYPDRPWLSEVTLYSWEVELGKDGTQPEYRFFDDDRGATGGGTWRTIRPDELYASKEAAETQLVKRLAVWTADQIRQMDRHGKGTTFADLARSLDKIGGLGG